MIYPNELRIGNLVKPGPEHIPPFDVEKYCEVTQVYKNGFTVDYHYPGQWFEAIPLTPELLVKCGFELLVGDYDFDTYSKNGIEVWEHDEGYCHSYAFGGDVDYLHQLQNLIFALNGEELEIKL